MRLLSEIAKELRKTATAEDIVAGIKNREISEIEENGYTTQQNYPNGVYVYAPNEEIGGVLFGTRGHGGHRTPGPGKSLGRPKSPEPRNKRKWIRWTEKEWNLVEEFGGKDLAKFQRDAILEKCR